MPDQSRARQQADTFPQTTGPLPHVRGSDQSPDRKGGAESASGATAERAWWRSKTLAWIGAAGVVVGLAALAAWYQMRGGGAGAGEAIDSVAVLPFENAGGDPNTEYLSDGIAESLISSLSQLPQLKVMSRDSAFSYKGKEVQADVVGRELGVRAVFKGQVRQVGDSLMVSAELIDVRDNRQIWGQQYIRKPSDIFALQEEIARDISDKLKVKLTGADEQKLAKRYTDNAEAYQDYIKGRFWWNKRNEEGFNKAIEYFQQAIEKDPTYALAYSGLSDTYQRQENAALISPQEAYPKAKAAALKAVELDDSLAEAHSSLANVANVYERDWPTAEREYKRAMELNPNYATAHQFYGDWFLGAQGRLDEGPAEVKRAEELDPLSPNIAVNVGLTLMTARQLDAAISEFRNAIELDPNYANTHIWLGVAYALKSQFPEAIAEGEKALELSQGATSELARLGSIYAVAGKKAEARKVLDQLEERAKRGYVPAIHRAEIYAVLGEKDRAFEWLGKAVDDRSSNVVRLKVWTPLESLRNDPRFPALLRRLGLENQ